MAVPWRVPPLRLAISISASPYSQARNFADVPSRTTEQTLICRPSPARGGAHVLFSDAASPARNDANVIRSACSLIERVITGRGAEGSEFDTDGLSHGVSLHPVAIPGPEPAPL